MMRSCFLILVLVVLGCDGSAPPRASLNPTLRASGSSVEEYIATWSAMGARLPDAPQIDFFRKNFDSARGALYAALSHPDRQLRMRAAYVIGEIGASAKPAGEDLLARLEVEPNEQIRIYIVEALSAMRYGTDAAISVLADRYAALDGTNVPPRANHSYAEADEKIAVASALYVLVKADAPAKQDYFDFVTKWLNPPADELSRELLEGYWERRWMAVNALERMPDATEAIPKIEALRAEPNAKPWVEVQVPRGSCSASE